jgi:hypothetical protein
MLNLLGDLLDFDVELKWLGVCSIENMRPHKKILTIFNEKMNV